MEEILRMIEEVDPADTAKLDEIDARVDAFVNDRPFNGYDTNTGFYETIEDGEPCEWRPPQYTRSRDALKSIRPEGWDFEILTHDNTSSWDYPLTARCRAIKYKRIAPTDPTGRHGSAQETFKVEICFSGPDTIFKSIPTEELAELHAIIQAISYERANHRDDVR